MQRIIFTQLPPPRFSFAEPPTNIPLAAGFLVSALNLRGRPQFQTEIIGSEIVDVFADRALSTQIARREPDVLAMTLYVWNVERSLFLASNIKRRSPKTVVLIGGPEVTPDNKWVLQHPAVDVAVFGEGESRIRQILTAVRNGKGIHDIPGSATRDRSGEIRLNTENPVAWNLSKCSYPYLEGTIGPSKDGTLFIETMRGCLFKCRYCYYHKAFCGIRLYGDDCIEKLLNFAYAKDSHVREIYLMDPTFNARKGFRKLLQTIAGLRRNSEYPRLHTELRADLLKPDDVNLLTEAGLISAEIGLQSVNPDVLESAGRKGDPEKVAEGASRLKNAGIEVTTGIIVGLPNDTRDGFRRTLDWLKRKDAYSVVHPFVLSVLPGTDFRAEAKSLGLKFNPKPPYFVRSTPTFSNKDISSALLECENVFDMEMDYIPPPSLVDSGPCVLNSIESADYVSKWILSSGYEVGKGVMQGVIDRATDPFTFWFRGTWDRRDMIDILASFTDANPHAIVNVVLELDQPPPAEFFKIVLESISNPDLFVNRYYEPLYGKNTIININFYMIVPHPDSRTARERIFRKYGSDASIIWELKELEQEKLSLMESPLLISLKTENEDHVSELFPRLRRFHADRIGEILFRDYERSCAWKSFNQVQSRESEFMERVLIT